MAIITDQELVTKLIEATIEGRIRWEKTGTVDRFAAKYAKKWTLTVDKAHDPDDPYERYWLALSNSADEEILKIYPSEEIPLEMLFDLARRRALKVDEAMEDLLKEISSDERIKDEDIPF